VRRAHHRSSAMAHAAAGVCTETPSFSPLPRAGRPCCMVLVHAQVPAAQEEAEDAEESQRGKRVPVPISERSNNAAAVQRADKQRRRAALKVVKEQGLQAICTGLVSMGAPHCVPSCAQAHIVAPGMTLSAP
jgi:hypothetical protein